MCLAKDDHVIEALTPNGADQALDVWILLLRRKER
jgi:hypothetical protein